MNIDLLQNEIRAKGEQIFKAMENTPSVSIFNKDWWYGQIMEWSMKNTSFKTQMFRFVDVLPYLNSGSEVARHLKEYFAEKSGDLPPFFNVGLGVGSLAPGLVAGAVKKNVTQMAKMFIAGEDPKEALEVIRKSRKGGLTFTADLLGEAALSEKESREYQKRYLELIEWLAKDAEKWPESEQLDRDHSGPIPKVNVSVKLSALYSQVSVKAWDDTKTHLKNALRPIFEMAMQKNVFVNLDMEHYGIKDLTLEVFKELILEPSLRNYPHFGVVIQAYLRDSLEDTKKMVTYAKERGTPITIRLVKGAYWDYETVLAQQKGWSTPVYLNKPESDANFEACAFELLSNGTHIRAALGSHNVRSIAACIVMAEKLGLPRTAYEIQMLYGMAEPIKKALSGMGFRVREYMPIGELIPGMAYLVRRLLENTSNESFLRSKFVEQTSQEKLLANPKTLVSQDRPHPKYSFDNEPLIDFAFAKERSLLEAELQRRSGKSYGEYKAVIGKKKIDSKDVMSSVNPSKSSHVVGTIHMATAQDADLAVTTAKEAFSTWKKISTEERCQLLEKLGSLMNQRRVELIGQQILETGKTWSEADGDVAEAIDFCKYYAQEMRRLANPKKVGHVPGEQSLYIYKPKGVAVVIAPWNFPLAILAGMTVAAAVTGNTVVMKPAEQSSVVAGEFMNLILEAGFPPGVINFLPGVGEVVGEHLVNHKDVDVICFTGSRSVGLRILEKAARIAPGQNHVKKVILEMGGKNAVIIDSDADLDEAVTGVLYSAFGFAGQKCSACSRAIVHADLYDRFVERLVEAARSIEVRAAHDPKAYLGPVIDKEAQQRILGLIEKYSREHKLLFKGDVPSDGFFVPPTIFGDVKFNSELAQEEIFGPVLAIIKVKSIEEAIEAANSTAYALTGGLFSRSPANIEKVRNEFEVGNLYINRQITGALVERHPFGGYKMSGVGSKAGGPDYLLQFMEPVVVTENTLRRGFAPEEG